MGVFTWMYCMFVLCEQPIESTTALADEGSFGNHVVHELNTGCDLSGYWYNQRGSEMFLRVSDQGYIKGEYRTAVEFSPGAAGDGPSFVTGWSNQEGTVFGFTVLWEGENSTSTTSWAGVCVPCEGVDTVTTTWVHYYHLPRQCSNPEDKMMKGSDVFTRQEQAAGPRFADRTNNPRDFRERQRALERNGQN